MKPKTLVQYDASTDELVLTIRLKAEDLPSVLPTISIVDVEELEDLTPEDDELYNLDIDDVISGLTSERNFGYSNHFRWLCVQAYYRANAKSKVGLSKIAERMGNIHNCPVTASAIHKWVCSAKYDDPNMFTKGKR